MRSHSLDANFNGELNWALAVLFGDIAKGRAFLDVPSETRELASKSQEERVQELFNVLIRSVVNMARELEELGSDERARLEAEARATLVAIREMALRFPECLAGTDSAHCH